MTTDLTLSDAAISLSDRQIYIPDSFRIMGGGQGGIQVWATAPVSNSARYTRPAVMTSGNHRVLRTATPQGASPSRPRLTTKPLTTSIASQAGGDGTTDSALPCRLKGQPCLVRKVQGRRHARAPISCSKPRRTTSRPPPPSCPFSYLPVNSRRASPDHRHIYSKMPFQPPPRLVWWGWFRGLNKVMGGG